MAALDTDRISQQAGPDAGAVRPGPDGRPERPGHAITPGLRVTGAGLLITAAAIHLALYLTGYRPVPVIGELFLLQVITGFGIGTVVLVTGSRVAAAGALFALATLGGYLLSVWSGLFGFTEIRTTAGISAGVIEVAAFATLAALAARLRPPGRPSRPQALPGPASAWLGREARDAAAAIASVSVVALVLLGAAVASAGGPSGAGPSAEPAPAVLKTTTIDGATVLAGRRSRRRRQARHNHPVRRLEAGHLRRAPAVHLHRRHRPRPGQRRDSARQLMRPCG